MSSRALRSWARRARPWLGVLALTAALALLHFDSTFLTTDAVMALAWGDEIARGALPDTSAPLLPVFHPLPTAVGVLFAPLDTDAALDAYRLLSVASLAFLAYSLYRLGGLLGGLVAGLLAAALALTRPSVVGYANLSAIDIPFAALVLLATALVLERPFGNRWTALGLLATAGLLRPEAWVLAVAYGGWLALRTQGGERAAVLAVALAAPVIWVASDLVLTGDPLNSTGQARAGADSDVADAGYPTSGSGERRTTWTILRSHWESLPSLLGLPLALGGVAAGAGALAGAYRGRRRAPSWRDREPKLDAEFRAALVAALAFGVLLTLLVMRLGGTVFTDRFALLAALGLAALYAAALMRFSPPLPWRAGLVAVAIGVLVTLPGDLEEIADDASAGKWAVENLGDATALAQSPDVARALSECPDAATGGVQLSVLGLGVLAMETDRDPGSIEQRYRPGNEPDTVLTYAEDPGLGRGSGPSPRRLVARNGSWELWSRCAPGRPRPGG